MAANNGRTTNFPPFSFVALVGYGIWDPRSEIRDKRSGIQDPGYEIRDPGSGMVFIPDQLQPESDAVG